VAAVFVATGIASFTLGLTIILQEAKVLSGAFLDFSKNYGIGSGVGPLSGKTIIAVIAFLVSWAILGYLWRGREVNFTRAFGASLVLLALGFLGTFPPIFELFIVK
jgi:hypothetical protein